MEPQGVWGCGSPVPEVGAAKHHIPSFRAAKLCYRRCHEETRTNKKPQTRGLQWANRGLQTFLTHFLFFLLNLHNKQFVFIVLRFFGFSAYSKYIGIILNVEKFLSQSSWNSFSQFINHSRCISLSIIVFSFTNRNLEIKFTQKY